MSPQTDSLSKGYTHPDDHTSPTYERLRISQGGSPSPFDRIQGTRQATLAANWLLEKIDQNKNFDGKLALIK